MRPRLTPAMADLRRAVRASLEDLAAAGRELRRIAEEDGDMPSSGAVRLDSRGMSEAPLVLVALSGGPDSLALAAATAFEARRMGLNAGAVIVDHGIQTGSAAIAARAAAQAESLGLAPVLVRRASIQAAATRSRAGRDIAAVPPESSSTPFRPSGGLEAAARTARYAALAAAAAETGAAAVLLGHTLDDQAETVLLGLVRGAGATSLMGMPAVSEDGRYRRPLLGIRRETTVAACADQGLEAWDDPMNADPAFTRVRIRDTVLPLLERELGPGIALALARTAEQLREDAEALDHMTEEVAEDLVMAGVDPVTEEPFPGGGISLPVAALAANPPAIRHRLIRLVAQSEFGRSLTRRQTLAAAALVTDWHGQQPLHLPGIRVRREGGFIVFSAAEGTGTDGVQ